MIDLKKMSDLELLEMMHTSVNDEEKKQIENELEHRKYECFGRHQKMN